MQKVASMLITVYNDNHAANDPRYLALRVQVLTPLAISILRYLALRL